jgi:hypothetical protein
LENKEDLKKMKEKERTDRMAAAEQCRNFWNQVMCREPKFEKHSSTENIKL